MQAWIGIALAAACGVLAILAVVLLVLWLAARRSLRRADSERSAVQGQRLDLERGHAEQTGRVSAARETLTVAVRGLTEIIEQAEGAQFASATQQQAAVRAVSSIADAARVTLGDLRRAIDALAGDGTVEVDDEPRYVSRDELIEVMRAVGLRVTLAETGEPFELAPSGELVVLRILQEALSNALEYGGAGTEATVSLTWTEDTLQLRVDDDGVRAAARRAGLDPDAVTAAHRADDDEHLATLVGVNGDGVDRMRARAELLGGVFKAVPVPGVGFSVAVVFPSIRDNNGVPAVRPTDDSDEAN